MIGYLFGKHFRYPILSFDTGFYIQSSHSTTYGRPFCKKIVVGDRIQLAEKFTRIVIDLVVAFFKLVKFFENHNRNVDVILFKIVQASEIVQNNIRV